MQWDKIKHRLRGKESAILYRVIEKGSERRWWLSKSLKEVEVMEQVRRRTGGRAFQDTESRKCQGQGNSRFGMLMGQETPIAAMQ